MTDRFNGVEEYRQLFQNASSKTEQKRKMRKLMAKYGENELDIENNSTPTDYMEFVLAGGVDVLEMVRKENAQSTQQPDYNPYNNNEDVIEEEEEEEEVNTLNIDALRGNISLDDKNLTYKNAEKTVKNDKARIRDTMGNQLSSANRRPKKNYELGTLSAEFESRDNPAAIGYDKTGGYSYGKYQIATKNGTMKDYLIYLSNTQEYKAFAQSLNAAGGNAAALTNTSSFEKAWKKLAKEDKFNQSQRLFIVQKNLNPMLRKIKDIECLNLENRHPVIKDVLYSVATQHGATGGSILLHNALKGAKKTLTDEEIINIIYDERSKVNDYFKSSSATYKNNLKNKRFPCERAKALKSLKE